MPFKELVERHIKKLDDRYIGKGGGSELRQNMFFSNKSGDRQFDVFEHALKAAQEIRVMQALLGKTPDEMWKVLHFNNQKEYTKVLHEYDETGKIYAVQRTPSEWEGGVLKPVKKGYFKEQENPSPTFTGPDPRMNALCNVPSWEGLTSKPSFSQAVDSQKAYATSPAALMSSQPKLGLN